MKSDCGQANVKCNSQATGLLSSDLVIAVRFVNESSLAPLVVNHQLLSELRHLLKAQNTDAMQHVVFIAAASLVFLKVIREGAASYNVDAIVVKIFCDSTDGS